MKKGANELSAPSPCRIVIHSEEPLHNGAESDKGQTQTPPTASHVPPKQVTPENERNDSCSSICIGGGRSVARNTCSPSGSPLSKKAMENIASSAVPRGYLKYWASRAGQDAADIPECEEFELAYSRRAQSLFPFRSTTTEWTVNMAGGAPFLESAFSIPLGVFLLVKYLEYLVRAHRGLISAMSKLSVCAGFVVLLMPWGPFMMLVGFFFGGILGFGLAMANDLCRLRRKTSAAAQQKKKIYHLVRWAGYHFASSNAQLQLIFKVVMEYEVLARLGDISKTARAQLRLLYSFLSRDDVGHCLWLYLDYFDAHFEQMTRNEIYMCALVCYVCTQCAASLRKRRNHPVLERMIGMLNDPDIQKIFQRAKTPNSRQARIDERTERCLFYADNSQGVQTFVMKGGDLLQSLHRDCTVGRNGDASEGGSFTDAISDSHVETDGSNEKEEREKTGQDTLAGELRPLENFNVALSQGFSVERAAPWTIEGTNSSATASPTKQLTVPPPSPINRKQQQQLLPQQRRKASSAPSAARSSSRASRHQQEDTNAEATNEEDAVMRQTVQEGKGEEAPARLFKNYEDLINFDITLKHQTPIAPYEFQFLEEREKHDPSDPSWEQTVNQPLISVYKYISPNSPVVIVKAYAKFDGIPLAVLSRNIRDVECRLKWDTTFADYRIVENDVDGCEMIYCVMKAPFPISNRDFLQWRLTVEKPEEGVVKMMLRSADHPSIPEQSGCVRAETLISGYLMRQSSSDPNSSSLFIVAQTDVKGLLPKWLVNSTAARAPVSWVDNLRRACKKYMEALPQEGPT
ncbi:hypothetical protein ETH_00018720 [Eimeria tenella]|uniref:START domain-containing protein n=1 Tax=Eimeria tenella TaxID=5802 RepID=U6L3H8_EIMTE|nr:hypothetical protein ETH_00018720 [Eimeria tenella]CDJ42325.1 hypothetical protein ETH_00018720 [Eimeria tenella]|eukprot:XP_013233075.1 hypothetical protein ETH_00018720 [Eimeria tenella]